MPVSIWVKIKDRAGAIVAVGSIVAMIFGVAAWSQDDTASQIRDAENVAKGRYEVQHSSQARELAVQSAKHDYDFYEVRGVQYEQELEDLEADVDDGVTLSTSQKRKMRRLEEQVSDFQNKQDEALERIEQAEEAANAEE